MQELEENIQFDVMPDFRNMFNQSKQDDWNNEKVYNTLFDELAEKCNPKCFCGDENFDKELFNKANDLYAELMAKKEETDNNLVPLRNKAMDELGIHISTKKKFDYLMQYLNPKIYIKDKEPYDHERVGEAGRWYALLIQNKSDIRALEDLEFQAKDFISKRKEEEGRKEEERKFPDDDGDDPGDDPTGIFIAFFLLVLLIIITIVVLAGLNNK